MDLKQLLTQTTIPHLEPEPSDDEYYLDQVNPGERHNHIRASPNQQTNDLEQGDEATIRVEATIGDEATIDAVDAVATIDAVDAVATIDTEAEVDLDPRFKHPWNKLEKGMKLNRIIIFVTQETKEKELSQSQSNALKQLLFKGCDMGLFNKLGDVKYNSETGIIESFKQLEFNETSKKYKIKTGSTKQRSVSKSRSNIDRLMKKS